MATRQKHMYIYIRVVTKYFYGNYNIYGPSSRPNNSLATRNAIQILFYQIIYLYYILVFYFLRLRYFYHKYSYLFPQNSLSSTYLLKYHKFLLTSTNLPRNYPLIPSYPVQPSSPTEK